MVFILKGFILSSEGLLFWRFLSQRVIIPKIYSLKDRYSEYYVVIPNIIFE